MRNKIDNIQSELCSTKFIWRFCIRHGLHRTQRQSAHLTQSHHDPMPQLCRVRSVAALGEEVVVRTSAVRPLRARPLQPHVRTRVRRPDVRHASSELNRLARVAPALLRAAAADQLASTKLRVVCSVPIWRPLVFIHFILCVAIDIADILTLTRSLRPAARAGRRLCAWAFAALAACAQDIPREHFGGQALVFQAPLPAFWRQHTPQSTLSIIFPSSHHHALSPAHATYIKVLGGAHEVTTNKPDRLVLLGCFDCRRVRTHFAATHLLQRAALRSALEN